MEEKKKIEPHKSSLFDLDANYVAVAAYVGGAGISLLGGGLTYLSWLVPLLIYILEKKSSFVKDHAKQSIGLTLLSLILAIILNIIGAATLRNVYNLLNGTAGFLALLSTVVGIFIAFLGVIAIIRAYNYKRANIPVANIIAKAIGPILDKFSVKVIDMIEKDDNEKVEEKKEESTAENKE